MSIVRVYTRAIQNDIPYGSVMHIVSGKNKTSDIYQVETVNKVFPVTYDFEQYYIACTQLYGHISPTKVPLSLSTFYLCCDICEPSFLVCKNGFSVKENILVPLNISKSGGLYVKFENPVRLKVTQPHVSQIKMYILDDEGSQASFIKCNLTCLLEFTPAL